MSFGFEAKCFCGKGGVLSMRFGGESVPFSTKP